MVKQFIKVGFCLSFMLFLTFHIRAQGIQNQQIKTQIEAVKIHLKGAEIIRESAVQLSTGKHQLVFHNLSPKMNAQSIQISPSEGVSILSITSRINFLKKQAAASSGVQ